MFPRDRNGLSTNWGHEMDEEVWWHVAVVNDGTHTKLLVDGAELLRIRPLRPPASRRRAIRYGGVHYQKGFTPHQP